MPTLPTCIQHRTGGNSLAVQWLGLSTFTAKDTGSIPGQGQAAQQPKRNNTVLEVLAQQLSKRKGIQVVKKEVKLPQFAHDITYRKP